MNASLSPRIRLDEYLRSFCGESTAPGMAIARACHELAAGGHLHGRYPCWASRADIEVLARFVDYVRSEERIPLPRERIETDCESALPRYPHVLEPVQE